MKTQQSPYTRRPSGIRVPFYVLPSGEKFFCEQGHLWKKLASRVVQYLHTPGRGRVLNIGVAAVPEDNLAMLVHPIVIPHVVYDSEWETQTKNAHSC